jgi:hypothetical protein
VKPSHAAWILTALFAVAVSASVYRIPIQVSDSVEILEAVDKTPSIAAAFAQGLYASRTMLRPMRQTVTKALLEAAHALGDRYNLVFRGFHAATAAVLIGLFTLVARPRSWPDAAALAFALLVLTGLHTFTGMVREAYPINHFLLVAIYCLMVFALAQAARAKSRGAAGLLVDVAACACFAIASLTLESGLVVATVAFAAYAAGLRGISRGALIAIAALTVGYVILRVGGLHMIGNAVGERQTGFGTMMLSTTDLRVRFGGMPWVLYAYTILSSALTVPFSQPIAGQWTAVGALRAEDFQDLFYLNDICTSLVATALVVWYLSTRGANGRRRWRDPIPLTSLAVLAGSAALSYAYAKSEIMSAAGVFYALVVFQAVAELARRLAAGTRESLRLPVLVIVLCISSAWAFRAVGLEYRLQRGAFDARSEWVLRMPPYHDPPVPETDARLTLRLRDEALYRGRTNPYLLWPRFGRLWGEN